MIYDYEQIKQSILGWGFPSYRYEQLVDTVFQQRITSFEKMNTLPQALRGLLVESFGNSFCFVRPVAETSSPQARKVLFALLDDNRIESVALRYKKGWESFCISSQIGCGFGCKFCATGMRGLKRHLTAKEIVDQVLYFYLSGHDIDSVSFMGMGEPLANPNVFDAIKLLTKRSCFGLSQRKITVSTAGVLPGILQMTKEFPQVNLAFSLHSPFEKQRSEIMPVNQTYPLHEVMRALDEHINKTKRKVFIAYILIDNVNDTPEHAKAIVNLLHLRTLYPHLYHVDLIPYNQADKISRNFKAPNQYRIKKFADVLKSAAICVTTRGQFGSDIDAACGQLYGRKQCDKIRKR